MRATSVYEFARATFHSPPFNCCSRRSVGDARVSHSETRYKRSQKKFGGEDRNRTYLGPAVAGSTTVLKTARTTRHPSLSGLRIADCGLRKDRQSLVLNARRRNCYYLSFLIARTIWSKSGQSPESSLEWRSLPLARISKAPPLEGMSVSDLMRSPSSRILVAKLTAFGV